MCNLSYLLSVPLFHNFYIYHLFRTFLWSSTFTAGLVSFAIFRGVDETITGSLLQMIYTETEHVKTAKWCGLALTGLHVDWLKQISSCTYLDVSKNSLYILPPSINKLKLLTRLDVSSNKLKNVPSELFNMEHLKTVDLSHNCINRLPWNNWSESLNSLYIQHNKLIKLPQTMSKSLISVLDISYNKFESVPLCVCDMLSLRMLNLSGNVGIFAFPKEMGRINPDVYIVLQSMDQVILYVQW